jgi:hypothetical protein
MDESSQRTRRRMLKSAMLLAGATLTSGLGVTNSLAQQKATKEAMKYQDKPSGEKQCSNCSQFTAPSGCKIVEGTVSPQGYCIAWVKK